jgi:toxin ParE1/3/4
VTPLRLISPVLDEIAEVTQRYLEESPAAARGFFDAVEHAEELIAENPHIGRPAERGTRRFPLPRFPYDVVYLIKPDETVILAVAHHRRHPEYWVDRL